MTQKDRVMNLFKFMMDLLDDDTKQPEQKKPEIKTILQNPTLPHHPLLNPYITYMNVDGNKVESKLSPKPTSPFNDPNSLFSKMELIQKRNGIELGKERAVKEAIKPLKEQLDNMKQMGFERAEQDKHQEEIELVTDDIKNGVEINTDNLPPEIKDTIIKEIVIEETKQIHNKEEK